MQFDVDGIIFKVLLVCTRIFFLTLKRKKLVFKMTHVCVDSLGCYLLQLRCWKSIWKLTLTVSAWFITWTYSRVSNNFGKCIFLLRRYVLTCRHAQYERAASSISVVFTEIEGNVGLQLSLPFSAKDVCLHRRELVACKTHCPRWKQRSFSLKQIPCVSKVNELHRCAHILAELTDPGRFCGAGSHSAVFIELSLTRTHKAHVF